MSESRQKINFKSFLQASVKALKHLFLHNGWLKLIAILISLVLWSGLVSQDASITRDKTFQNVNVNVLGMDTLMRNGYIVVSDLNEILSDITAVAAVPQMQYESAEASAYNLRIDLSRLKGTGMQELKILSTGSAAYGKIVNTVPAVLNVEVEEYSVRQRIPVSVKVGGEYQNGWYRNWYMPNPNVDPTLITVSGPRDLAQSISIARVFIDPDKLEWAEGTLWTTGEIKLYNRAGEEIQSPLLDITTEGTTIDTVLIEGNVLPTKSFSVSNMIEMQGEVKEGFRLVSFKVSPETVTVAARNEVLEQMNELALDRNISLEDLEETTVFQLKVQKPSEDAVLSNETVTVTAEIERKED